MTTELAQQLIRLDEERARLNGLLARHPAWLELCQLDQEPAPADAASFAEHARRRDDLERQFSGNPDYDAHRNVVLAIAKLQDKSAARSSVGDDATKTGELSGIGGGVSRSATIHDALPGHRDVAADQSANAAPDDLTRIRRIDRALAVALVARGVRSFAQMAAFGAADVRSLAVALGLGRRISQENWIEQAAVLALKQRARAPQLHRVAEGPALPRPASDAERGAEPAAALSLAMQADIAAVARTIAADVARRQIESQSKPQANPGDEPRVIHYAGEQTCADDAKGEAAHEDPPNGATTGDPASPGPTSATSDVVRAAALRIADRLRMPSPEVTSLAPVAAEITVVADANTADANSPATNDDLTRVRGIDADAHSVLAGLNVTRFAQIAVWHASDVRSATMALAQAQVMADISRDGWIEQAAVLARGGQTDYAARIARGELHALVSRPHSRNTRDDSFAAWLAQHAAPHAAPPVDDGVHDLPAVPMESAQAEAEVGAETEADSEVEADAEVEAEAGAEAEPVAELKAEPDPVAEPAIELLPVPELSTANNEDAAVHAFVDESVVDLIEPAEPFVFDEPPSSVSTPHHRVIEQIAAWMSEHPSSSQVAVPEITHAQSDPVEQTQVRHAGDDESPAATAVGPAWTIADRITAIELEAASLSLRQRPGAVGRRPTGHLTGHPLVRTVVGEAEVKIVMREAHDQAHTPPPVADIADAAPEEVDPNVDDYAAYRGRVEEASVEIVRDGRAWGPEDTALPEDSGAVNATGPAQQATGQAALPEPEQQGRVRRFLKALTGA